MILNKTSIWLEPIHLHFHHGDKVEVKLVWGMAMKGAQTGKPGDLTGIIIDPTGQENSAEVLWGEEDWNCKLVANSGTEGIYTIQAESFDATNGENVKRYARMLVPVGHHVHGEGQAINRGLEIVAGEYFDFHPGDEIELSLVFQGHPMPEAKILATHHLNESEGFLHEIWTDSQGKAKFAFDAKGHWMFQATNTENETMHIATLVIPGVR